MTAKERRIFSEATHVQKDEPSEATAPTHSGPSEGTPDIPEWPWEKGHRDSGLSLRISEQRRGQSWASTSCLPQMETWRPGGGAPSQSRAPIEGNTSLAHPRAPRTLSIAAAPSSASFILQKNSWCLLPAKVNKSACRLYTEHTARAERKRALPLCVLLNSQLPTDPFSPPRLRDHQRLWGSRNLGCRNTEPGRWKPHSVCAGGWGWGSIRSLGDSSLNKRNFLPGPLIILSWNTCLSFSQDQTRLQSSTEHQQPRSGPRGHRQRTAQDSFEVAHPKSSSPKSLGRGAQHSEKARAHLQLPPHPSQPTQQPCPSPKPTRAPLSEHCSFLSK